MNIKQQLIAFKQLAGIVNKMQDNLNSMAEQFTQQEVKPMLTEAAEPDSAESERLMKRRKRALNFISEMVDVVYKLMKMTVLLEKNWQLSYSELSVPKKEDVVEYVKYTSRMGKLDFSH